MRFSAWLDGQEEPLVRDYYSVGGGAVLPGAEAIAADAPLGHNVVQPYPFSSGAEMLALGESTGLSIARSEEHTSELQSLMRISYAVFCLKKKTKTRATTN